MLAIPNTTTTALDTSAGAAVFPVEQGALSPYASGYLFVANQAAQISVKRGPTSSEAQWSPFALVSPSMIPLSTDRVPTAGKPHADLIFGVKAIDGVAGTHAQVFGALFQPGEAGFLPATQFTGTVAPSGGFTPPASGDMQLLQTITVTVAQAQVDFQGLSQSFTHLLVEGALNVPAGDGTVAVACVLNGNVLAGNYFNQRLQQTGAVVSSTEANGSVGFVELGNANGNFVPSPLRLDLPNYVAATQKGLSYTLGCMTGVGAGALFAWTGFGFYRVAAPLTRLTFLRPDAGLFQVGSVISVYGLT